MLRANGQPVFSKAFRPATRRRRQSSFWMASQDPRACQKQSAPSRDLAGRRCLTPSLENASTPLRDRFAKTEAASSYADAAFRYGMFHLGDRQDPLREHGIRCRPRSAHRKFRLRVLRLVPATAHEARRPRTLRRQTAQLASHRAPNETSALVPQTAAATQPDSALSVRFTPLHFRGHARPLRLARASAAFAAFRAATWNCGDRQADSYAR